MARSSPTVSHLFFADDNIIFCGASINNWNEVPNILGTYEATSGQGINKHKFRIFFGANTHLNLKGNILNIASVPPLHQSGEEVLWFT